MIFYKINCSECKSEYTIEVHQMEEEARPLVCAFCSFSILDGDMDDDPLRAKPLTQEDFKKSMQELADRPYFEQPKPIAVSDDCKFVWSYNQIGTPAMHVSMREKIFMFVKDFIEECDGSCRSDLLPEGKECSGHYNALKAEFASKW